MSNAERRERRREIRHLKNESVWLQKALFAFRKAEDAHEQLADTRGQKVDSYMVPIGEEEIAFEELEAGLDKKIDALMKEVREMRRELY